MKKILFIFVLIMSMAFQAHAADNQNAKNMPVQVENNSDPMSPQAQEGAMNNARDFQKRARQFVQDSMNIWSGLDTPGIVQSNGSLVRTDVKETPNELIVTYDLPGVKKEDIKITLDRGVLTVQGIRGSNQTDTDNKQDTRYYTRERYQGSFIRSFSLPTAVQEDKIQAKFENGVLTLTIPKATTSAAKVIPVR